MSKPAIDYSQKPYSFYVVSKKHYASGLSKPLAITHLVQLVPWNRPFNKVHKELISGNRVGQGYTHETILHDPEAGLVHDHIFYFNPNVISPKQKTGANIPFPTKIATEFGIKNIISQSWEKPEKRKIAELARLNNCAAVLQEKIIYSLVESSATTNAPLVITIIQLLEPGSIPIRPNKPTRAILLSTVEDSRFGPLSCCQVFTDSIHELAIAMDMATIKSLNSTNAWGNTGKEILARYAFHFAERPNEQELWEARRLMGLAYDTPQKGLQ